jgi:sucrose-phosphate synthase
MADPLREHNHITSSERAVLDQCVKIVDQYDLWGKITAFPLDSQAELAAGYRYLAERRSVFALTALYEPFGLAPLEAMAAGLPAVVTQNGGPSESLFDAATGTAYGVLVDPADPQDIARGLLEVVGNADRWRDYHDAGISRVHDAYTWQRTAAGYLAVIEQILAHLEPIPAYFRNPSAGVMSPALLASLYLPS